MTQPPEASVPKIAIIAGVALAIIVTGLVAAYQFWSPEKATKMTTLVTVLVGVLVAVLLLIWLIWKLGRWLKDSKARRQEMQANAARAEAAPEVQAELDTLQEKVNTAVKVLRESKLAKGKTAEEALYTLPWVLLLGPTESGKTTLLRECGVDFPYTTTEMQKFAKKGQASGCEFWFSREGIILDLAGNLATGMTETETLSHFLDMLKRARRTRPLDGVVVTIGIREILDRPTDQVEKMANVLRQRFDLLIRRLGIRFPIYILFTKCDQVEGFQEFFANMRSRDRAQVWGATISRAQRKRLPATQIFQQEFDRLAEALYMQRLPLMAHENDSSKLPQIFTFPAQFASLRDKLTAFVGTLLEPTPYSERPMFRGFYLSSAAVVAPSAETAPPPQPKWDAMPYRASTTEEPPKSTRVFFLETLFPEVIFADRPLTTASVDSRLKRRRIHDFALAATVVLCALLFGFTTYSYVQNSRLVETINMSAVPLSDPGWSGRTNAGLRTLEDLRLKVVEVAKYQKEGPPWKMRWGLYTGDDVYEPIRRQYNRRLREFYLSPASESLRQTLYTMAGRSQTVPFDDFYNSLKTYLIMTAQASEPAPEEWALNNGLEAIWKKLSPGDAEGQVLASTQLRYYANRMAQRDQDLILPRDEAVVNRARQALRQYSFLEQMYARLKSQVNAKFTPFTLELATAGKTEYLSGSRAIPGIFTEAGWAAFREQVGQASKRVMQNDWVLGSADTGATLAQAVDSSYDAKMREWYFAEYSEEWYRFLDGISIRPMTDLTDAKNALDLFAQQDASLAHLLQSVAANTMLRREPKPQAATPAQGGAALLQRVSRSDLVEAVADKFAGLHEMAASIDGKIPSPISQYFDALGRIRNQFQGLLETGVQGEMLRGFASRVAGSAGGDDFREAYRVSQRVRQACSTTKYSSPVGPLLDQPIRQAWAALLKDMMGQLDIRWKTQVADSYRREVESSFPFNPNSQQDLPFSVLTKYFKSGDGVIWAFYEKEIKSFMPSSDMPGTPSVFTLRPAFTREFLEFIERAKAVREALYATGGAEPSVVFDLTPEGTPEVTESILEIDGQPQLRYRNELPMPQSFSWPGKPGPPQSRISIAVTGSSERPTIPAITGDWAFFRLLQKASVDVQSATTYRVTWNVPSSDPRKFIVRYRLQTRNATNPFVPGFFREVRCPDRVILAGAQMGTSSVAP